MKGSLRTLVLAARWMSRMAWCTLERRRRPIFVFARRGGIKQAEAVSTNRGRCLQVVGGVLTKSKIPIADIKSGGMSVTALLSLVHAIPTFTLGSRCRGLFSTPLLKFKHTTTTSDCGVSCRICFVTKSPSATVEPERALRDHAHPLMEHSAYLQP